MLAGRVCSCVVVEKERTSLRRRWEPRGLKWDLRRGLVVSVSEARMPCGWRSFFARSNEVGSHACTPPGCRRARTIHMRDLQAVS